ncbi:hypothetical protein KR51_00018380 [Rubidibacter lacunae KORDI 51-2]|uniref:Uncharacterized protein n=1 Tax=Rubidibacter lacunae KORDI 51-2 TaxID=582515 RepID=U5DIX0_9CHRO|nr:hypothetical protein KR51_00018380 [Rubidibacter lacunae KORDI 51-2]
MDAIVEDAPWAIALGFINLRLKGLSDSNT